MRILCSALVVVALGLIVSALGVGAGGLPWADENQVADGHPQRIEKPYVVRDLPGKPGPIAGLVREGLSWSAISPHGRVWKLADAFDDLQIQPALSDDGRVLAYLRETSDGAGEYVLRNLVTGSLTYIPEVTGGNGSSEATFFISGQQPTYLSPDGQQVLARGGRIDGRDNDGFVISKEGVRELFVEGEAWPAGFAPDGRLGWLVTPRSETSRTPELVATTDTGEEVGRLKLHLSEPMGFDQWSPRLSPDGRFLSLAIEDSGRTVIAVVSLEDGREIERHTVPTFTICQPTWRGDEVLTPGPDHALIDADRDAVVVADPSIEADCSIWATDAISGDEHRGFTGTVFGTSTSWWSWRWRQLGAGLLLIVAALGLLWSRPVQREI